MEYGHRHRVITFVFHYLIVTYLLVVFSVLSGGVAQGLLTCVLAAAAGYFVVGHKWNHIRQKEKEEEKEAQCQIAFCVVAIIVSVGLMGSAQYTYGPSERLSVGSLLLIWLLLMSIFGTYLYAEYYREKYMTMYVNPCVTQETIQRFEGNTKRRLRKTFLWGAIAAMLVFTVAATISNVDFAVEKQEQEKEAKEKKKSKSRPKADPKKDVKELEDKKTEPSAAWLAFTAILTQIMQIVVLVLVVVGILSVIFIILRNLLSIRLPKYERIEDEEEEEVETMVEEYISLRPKTNRREHFSNDSNGKIRRIFYRHIRKQAGKEKIDVSMTPWELANTYITEEQQSAVEIYEKARYSGEMCSEEEVQAMRETLR